MVLSKTHKRNHDCQVKKQERQNINELVANQPAYKLPTICSWTSVVNISVHEVWQDNKGNTVQNYQNFIEK